MFNKTSENSQNWRKTPIKVSQIPSHVTGGMYLQGIQEITGSKGYIPHDIKRVLKKAGLSETLYGSGSVSKYQFLRAVKALENEGVIKHKSGHAEAIFRQMGAWERWQKVRKKNIEERKKDYAGEALQEADETSRANEKLTKQRLSGVSGSEVSSELGRAVVFSSADRARDRIRKLSKDLTTKKDKRDYLQSVRGSKTETDSWSTKGSTGWSGRQSGWTGSGSSWQAPKK